MDDPGKDFIFRDGKSYFYGGKIICICGDIRISAMDKILDLIDDYIDLVESLEE